MPLTKAMKRPTWEIRNALPEHPAFTSDEVVQAGIELEQAYNALAATGAPPSDLFARVVLFFQLEGQVRTHPDRDNAKECPHCGRF